MSIIPREFYQEETHVVAEKLLGQKLVRVWDDGSKSVGIINETEAYGDSTDFASHAGTKITKRNRVVYGPQGHSYVYLIYGLHYCFNITSRSVAKSSGGILIRSIKPISGLEKIKENRGAKASFRNLCNGPGKLTQSLKIGKEFYGLDLTQDNQRLYLEFGEPVDSEKITITPRIGIKKSVDKLWRFKLEI